MLSDDIAVLAEIARTHPANCHISNCSNQMTGKQWGSADVILRMLHAIARESEAVHATSRALFVARAAQRTIEHTTPTRQLGRSCRLLMSHIARLQKLVVEFDEDIAGVEMGSLAELGVRAQTLGILLLLDELHHSISYRSAVYQELFTARLRTIEDVVWHLFDSLARINQLWLRHRAKPQDLVAAFGPRLSNTTRSRQYRSAIRLAQREIARLRSDPDLAHFLRTGSSRTDAPRIRRACNQLSDVLGVVLTRETDPAQLLAELVLEPEELLDMTNDDDTTS